MDFLPPPPPEMEATVGATSHCGLCLGNGGKKGKKRKDVISCFFSLALRTEAPVCIQRTNCCLFFRRPNPIRPANYSRKAIVGFGCRVRLKRRLGSSPGEAADSALAWYGKRSLHRIGEGGEGGGDLAPPRRVVRKAWV